MAFSYYFTKPTGFWTGIEVIKDGIRIYRNGSATSSREVLLSQAKLALKDNYPNQGVETMVEIAIPATPFPDPPKPPAPPPPPPPPTATPSPVRKKLSSNRPKGKGIEGIITSISKQLANIDTKVDDIYYGNKAKNTGIKLPGSTSKVNGILPIAQEIAKIDLCNILTFLLSNVKLPKDSVVGKKLKRLEEKTKALGDKLAKTKVGSAAIKNTQNLKDISLAIADTTNLIDDDVISVVPQLANAKNYLDDIKGTITSYANLNTVPNADVQRILSKLKGVESTVSSIKSISSTQDALNIVQSATNLNITGQIQQLQKLLNPAQLLPTLRKISTTLKGINQIALKILNFIRILQVITKVSAALLTVLNIIQKILSLIPIPNIVTVVAITQKFSDALQSIKKVIEVGLKRVAQIGKLVELIYNFAISLIAKIGDLIGILDTIIYNLQTCEVTTDDPAVEDLLNAKASLQDTTGRLNAFTATYAAAVRAGNGSVRVYNGLTLRIVEEVVVDNGVINKRRKAVALDTRGVLIAETDLTFATDTDTLYQELELLLRNKGVAVDTSSSIGTANTDPLDIDFTDAFPSDEDAYTSVGLDSEDELVATSAEASAEVSNFINGIKKGGKKFKRIIKQILGKFATDSAQSLKDSAKAGTFKGTSPASSKFAGSLGAAAKTSTGGQGQRTITPEEKSKWESIIRNPKTSVTLRARAQQILKTSQVVANTEE